MRFLALLFGCLMTWFCLMLPAQAANPEHLSRLLETRACVGCDVQGADLQGKDLRGVDLSRANLKNANLSRTQLFAVKFKAAQLQGANLSNADLLVVDFTQANLEGAQADLINLESATVCHTVIPDGSTSNRDCQQGK